MPRVSPFLEGGSPNVLMPAQKKRRRRLAAQVCVSVSTSASASAAMDPLWLIAGLSFTEDDMVKNVKHVLVA